MAQDTEMTNAVDKGKGKAAETLKDKPAVGGKKEDGKPDCERLLRLLIRDGGA